MQSLNLIIRKLRNVSALVKGCGLQSLNLTEYKIADVSVLARVDNLQSLNLLGTGSVNVSLTGSLTVDRIRAVMITQTFVRP